MSVVKSIFQASPQQYQTTCNVEHPGLSIATLQPAWTRCYKQAKLDKTVNLYGGRRERMLTFCSAARVSGWAPPDGCYSFSKSARVASEMSLSEGLRITVTCNSIILSAHGFRITETLFGMLLASIKVTVFCRSYRVVLNQVCRPVLMRNVPQSLTTQCLRAPARPAGT